jgi:hypothetical protein
VIESSTATSSDNKEEARVKCIRFDGSIQGKDAVGGVEELAKEEASNTAPLAGSDLVESGE